MNYAEYKEMVLEKALEIAQNKEYTNLVWNVYSEDYYGCDGSLLEDAQELMDIFGVPEKLTVCMVEAIEAVFENINAADIVDLLISNFENFKEEFDLSDTTDKIKIAKSYVKMSNGANILYIDQEEDLMQLAVLILKNY